MYDEKDHLSQLGWLELSSKAVYGELFSGVKDRVGLPLLLGLVLLFGAFGMLRFFEVVDTRTSMVLAAMVLLGIVGLIAAFIMVMWVSDGYQLGEDYYERRSNPAEWPMQVPDTLVHPLFRPGLHRSVCIGAPSCLVASAAAVMAIAGLIL